MISLIGEFECKIDAKGRMRLPGSLLKQLGTEGTLAFVVNRGIEKHLTLYPKSVWNRMEEEVRVLNKFNDKNREFARFMYRGATELTPDGQDRVLLSKRLLDYAGIKKEVVLQCILDRIEIWDPAAFDAQEESKSAEDFSKIANDVSAGMQRSVNDGGGQNPNT